MFDGSRHPPAESGNTGPRPLTASLRWRSIDNTKAGSLSVRSPALLLVLLRISPTQSTRISV